MPLFGGNGFLGTNWTPIKDITNAISGATNVVTNTVGGVVNSVTPLVTNVANSSAGVAATQMGMTALLGPTAGAGSSILGSGIFGAQVGVQTGPGYTQPATWFQKQIYKVDANGKFILNIDKSKQLNWIRIGMWVFGIYITYLVIKRMVKGRWSWI